MSELLTTGKLEPITEVSQRITGERPSRCTIWRWLRKGVNGGVRLEAVPGAYGRWYTTEAAYRDFLARRAEAQLQPHETVPPASDDDLRAEGLL